MSKLEEAEKVEVNGKPLIEWAKSNPVRLEKMFEHEFNETLREQMLLVYREYCMGGINGNEDSSERS